MIKNALALAALLVPAAASGAPGPLRPPTTPEIVPCDSSAEKNPETIRELFWRLANLELLIGYDKMLNAYGKVDVCEHAIITDDIWDMAQKPPPLPTDKYPYDQIVDSGGLFLPVGVKYNHAVCAGPLGELDMRWFIHGYLGGGLVKEAVGEVYNAGQGYLGSDAGRHNAAANMASLKYGKYWRGRGKTLADFARLVLNGLGVGAHPPKSGRYREWASHVPLEESALRDALEDVAPHVRMRVRKLGHGWFQVVATVDDRETEAMIRSAALKLLGPKHLDDRLTRRKFPK